MKALVTGGTGFLGRRVVSQLIAAGWKVRCLVRRGSDLSALRNAVPKSAGEYLEFFEGNLDDFGSCVVAVVDCSCIFHIAAELKGATALLFLTNVVGTRNLLKAATTSAVERFVLVSSLAVYDAGRLRHGGTLDESYPLEHSPHLRDPYTYSKVVQEQVAWEAHRETGFPLVVIRPGVIYGPGRDCLTARVGLKLGCFMITMGGNQLMPYTHAENCAQALVLAGTQPAAVGQAFNIIDDELPSGRTLMKQHCRQVGGVRNVTLPGWLIPAVSRLSEWYHGQSRGQLPAILTRYKSRAMWTQLLYSNARAKTILGWEPKKQFPEGLRETFEWLVRDRTEVAIRSRS